MVENILLVAFYLNDILAGTTYRKKEPIFCILSKKITKLLEGIQGKQGGNISLEIRNSEKFTITE